MLIFSVYSKFDLEDCMLERACVSITALLGGRLHQMRVGEGCLVCFELCRLICEVVWGISNEK